MLSKSMQSLRNFYRLFTSGLTRAEIERLVKVDTRGMYAFYVRSMQRPESEAKPLKRFLGFCRNLFLTFLLKLTPARRLLYGIAFVLFVLAVIYIDWWYAFYSFLILNFLLALELADKLIAKDELAIAREIQLSLLPRHDNTLTGYEIASFSDAARSVGGDYYDFIPLPDGSALVVIGDVSGKGISAALYMVKVQTMLQMFARESANPCDLLNRLNNQLYRQLKRNYFLTIALARLHPTGEMELCRAGHTPTLLFDSENHHCQWLEPKGIAIGLENGPRFNDNLELLRRLLKPGDTLLLFTDGVVETANSKLIEFGENRLAQFLSKNSRTTPEQIKAILLQELTIFRNGAELRDDTTFVVIKRCA
jgi:sigma-B regulation protein RsbU (phosphoserine phosphatase)